MLAKQLGLTNKVVSERHYYTSQTKLTAGEAAKAISKHTGKKVLAKDVKELYQVRYGREAEWHHSGFYRDNNGKTMGRTFFLSGEEVEELANNYDEICAKRDEQVRKEATSTTTSTRLCWATSSITATRRAAATSASCLRSARPLRYRLYGKSVITQ